MVLNNYWLIKTYTEVNTMISTAYTVNLGNVNMSGSTSQIFVNVGTGSSAASFMSYANPARCIKTDLKAVLGTGTTTPQPNDYRLANDVTSSFSNLATVCSTSSDGSSEVTTLTISGTNTSGSDVTINEIGIYKDIYTNSSGNYSSFLLVREVLAEPFTVLAGSSFTKTFTWTEGSSAAANASRSVVTEPNNSRSVEEDLNKTEPIDEKREEEEVKTEPIDEKREEEIDDDIEPGSDDKSDPDDLR